MGCLHFGKSEKSDDLKQARHGIIGTENSNNNVPHAFYSFRGAERPSEGLEILISFQRWVVITPVPYLRGIAGDIFEKCGNKCLLWGPNNL